MKRNVGNTDRVIRVVLGLAIGVLGIVYGSWWGLLALIPLGTALIGWCPAYRLMKVSTYKQDSKKRLAEAARNP